MSQDVLAEFWVNGHPWRKEDMSQEVRFRPPGAGASWPERFEGREYLDAVMRVASPEQMLRFLNEYGDPGSHSSIPREKVVPSLTVDKSGKFKRILNGKTIMRWFERRGYIDFSQFRELQQVLRKAAEVPVEKWGEASIRWFNVSLLKVELNFEEGHLTGECVAHPGVLACTAQLFFEKLSGAEYGWCARPDCSEYYRLESKHHRKYCSQECAHVVAVRAARERTAQRRKTHKVS
jgi:hypothetical protein